MGNLLLLPMSQEVARAQEELARAAEVGEVEAIKQALAAGANVNRIVSGSDRSPLMLACARSVFRSSVDYLQALFLQKDVDVNLRDTSGNTALHYVSGSVSGTPASLATGLIAAMRFLIERGADVNALNKVRQSPLHISSRFGHGDAVRLLLDSGARVDIGDSALSLGVNWGSGDVIKMLVDAGEQLSPAAGQSLIRQALDQSRLSSIIALTECGFDVNTLDRNGQNSLHRFSFGYGNRINEVRRLVDLGCNPNHADSQGITPLHLAANDALVTRILIDAGADVNAESNTGRTPLLVACEAAYTFVRPGTTALEILLEAGADPHARTKDGDDAMAIAQKARCDWKVKVLRQWMCTRKLL